MVPPGFSTWRNQQRNLLQAASGMRERDGLIHHRAARVVSGAMKREGDRPEFKQRDDKNGGGNGNGNGGGNGNGNGSGNSNGNGAGSGNRKDDKDNKGSKDKKKDDQTTAPPIAEPTTAPSSTSIELTTASTSSSIASSTDPTTSSSTSLAVPTPPPPSTPAAVSPLAVSSTSSIVTSDAVTSSPSATTIWLTTSSVSTVTVDATPSSGTALADSSFPSGSSIVIGQQDRGGQSNDYGGKGIADHRPPPPPNNNKFAMAFGVLGGVGFLVGIIWVIMLLRQRRQRRRKHGLYNESLSKRKRDYFTFNQLSLPFSRSNPDVGQDGDSVHSVQGYLDEKRHDPRYPIPVLEPAPVHQASIRKSIVSWFKRSSGHHPLKLNAVSRWSRSTKAASALRRTHTAQSESHYSVSARDMTPGEGNVPPMPNLDPSQSTTNISELDATTPEVSMPASVFSREDARAYYTSHWSDSTGIGERTSAGSSWTSGTRTTMQGGRASEQVVGPSPNGVPGAPTKDDKTRETAVGTGAPSSLMLGAGPGRSTSELTNLREELLDLYKQSATEVGQEQHTDATTKQS